MIVYRNRLLYYEEEKANIEADIETIKFMSLKGKISEKRAKKIVKSIEKINFYKMKIENIINTVDDETDKNILYLRFIKGLTIKKISDIMCYSKSSISRKLLKYEGQDK